LLNIFIFQYLYNLSINIKLDHLSKTKIYFMLCNKKYKKHNLYNLTYIKIIIIYISILLNAHDFMINQKLYLI
jgi:hypothetical protein